MRIVRVEAGAVNNTDRLVTVKMTKDQLYYLKRNGGVVDVLLAAVPLGVPAEIENPCIVLGED